MAQAQAMSELLAEVKEKKQGFDHLDFQIIGLRLLNLTLREIAEELSTPGRTYSHSFVNRRVNRLWRRYNALLNSD